MTLSVAMRSANVLDQQLRVFGAILFAEHTEQGLVHIVMFRHMLLQCVAIRKRVVLLQGGDLGRQSMEYLPAFFAVNEGRGRGVAFAQCHGAGIRGRFRC